MTKNPSPSEELLRAIDIARIAHADQTRKNGEPYVNHPFRVSDHVITQSEKIIAVLHDVLEDTEITPGQLIDFHISKKNVRLIQILTREKNETYYDYIHRIIKSKNKIVMRVKMVDLDDNMSDLEECTLKDKYRFARDAIKHAMEEL